MNIEILRTIMADQRLELFKRSNDEIKRSFNISKQLAAPEASVITGVRRCGKSTILKQIARNLEQTHSIHYLNFEEQKLSQFSVDDFNRAYEEFLLSADLSKKQILIYDEIQLIDGWERWVAGLTAKANIKVFLSGSNSKLLSSELSTLLTGRHVDVHTTPLSFAEIVSAHSKNISTEGAPDYSTVAKIHKQKLLKRYMQYGGFPRAFLSQDTSILSQYYEDILFKDIVTRRKVRNIAALKSLGSILASQNARLFSQSKAAIDIQVQQPQTVAKFCDYFKETFLYSEVRLFSKSRRTQLRGKAKFYAVDPLLAYETGYHHSDSNYWILENHVLNELLRRKYEVFYWHSKRGYEVDFIALTKHAVPIAIQVATNISDPDTFSRELRAIEAAKAELGIDEALIITVDEAPPELLVDLPGTTTIKTFHDWANTD